MSSKELNTASQLSLEDLLQERLPSDLSPVLPQGSLEQSTRKKVVVQGQKQDENHAPVLAPMLQQYVDLKKEYPEHVLLFQVGDFYEVFFGDAKIVSETLQIRLTSRSKSDIDPIPMCGVPIHAIENYLPKLVEAGFSCVLMSQVEDAKAAKGLVRREITRIVTPGVRYEGDGLNEREHNYLAACVLGGSQSGAISFIDVSTGKLTVTEVESAESLREFFEQVRPSELIVPKQNAQLSGNDSGAWIRDIKKIADERRCHIVQRSFGDAQLRIIHARLLGLFTPDSRNEEADGLLLQLKPLSPEALSALDVIINYIEEVSFGRTPNIVQFRVETQSSGVFIDAATRRNLELTETRIDGNKRNSLLARIDCTKTAMGCRLLSDWILNPSRELEIMCSRHESVEELVQEVETREAIRELFASVRDIDRLVSRIGSLRSTPRDFGTLRDSLLILPRIFTHLARLASPRIQEIAKRFDSLEDIAALLQSQLLEELPTKLNEGGIIRDGAHAEVDRLRSLRADARASLALLEAEEKEKSGIGALKVKYNNVFGYFIEVTKAHLSKIPDHFERRQTLVNAERFVTPALKQFEQEIFSAKAKQIDLERELFNELRELVHAQSGRIQKTASLLSELDVLFAFAHLASKHRFVRPVMHAEFATQIVAGRHPVVEQITGEHNFVPNDTLLDSGEHRFAILTGPNMGGKSTYLRQIGIIQLLAQAGSFVPAVSAELGVVDRIFTRIGAADDVSRGDSTFMVEMREAASILKKATSRSLVLIDEIGRGTATSDGLAIATAIAEWLHDVIRCRTVFATHFHELTLLAGEREGMFCLAVGVVENDGEILFTHQIEQHAASRSYGIEVARLAGLPDALLDRAEVILHQTDEQASLPKEKVTLLPSAVPKEIPRGLQELVESLRRAEPNSITPLQAINELARLKTLVS